MAMVKTSALDHDAKRYAMIKHGHTILTDAICDLHAVNTLSEKAGFRVSDSIFDTLDRLDEEMKSEMLELGTKTGLV